MAENLVWPDPPGTQAPSQPQPIQPPAMEWPDPPGSTTSAQPSTSSNLEWPEPPTDSGSTPSASAVTAPPPALGGEGQSSSQSEPAIPRAVEPGAAPGGLSPSITQMLSAYDQAYKSGPSFASDIGTGVQRSFKTAGRDISAFKGATGMEDPAAAAQDYVQQQRDLDTLRYNADVEAGLKEFSQIPQAGRLESAANVLSWMKRNPRAVAGMMGEQAVSLLAGTATSIAGGTAGSVLGPEGTVAGAVAGAGLASGAQEFSSAFSDFLQAKNIDPTNQAQVQGVLENPQALSEARDWMLKRGIAVGAIDAFTSFLGVKGFGHSVAGTLLKEGAARTIAAGAVNAAVEGLGEGVSEGLATKWTTGQVNYPEAFLEGALGVVGGLGEATYDTYLAEKEQPGHSPSSEDLVNAFGGYRLVDEPLPTANQAVAEGRTWFGVTDKENQGPIPVFDNYDDAEAVAGTLDLRKNDIIAVKPEEVQDTVLTTPEEVAAAIENPDHMAWEKLKGHIAKFEPGIADNLNQVATHYDERTNVGGFSPETNKTWLQKSVQTVLGTQGTRKVFVGDKTEKRIAPLIRNQTQAGMVSVDNSGVVRIQESPYDARAVDLDKYQRNIQELGGIVVPTWDLTAMDKTPRLDSVIDNAFSFASPQVREEFLAHQSSREQLLATQQVQWKRFDPRILRNSWQVAGISSDLAQQAITNSLVKVSEAEGLGRTEPRHAAFTANTLGGPDEQEILTHPRDVIGPSNLAPEVQALQSWLEELRKKFGITQKILFVPRDGAGQLHGTRATLKSLFANLAAENASWSFGYFLPISEEILVLNVNVARPLQEQYRTLAHEFGHVVSWAKFSNAPLEIQNKIYGAYRRFAAATKNINRVDIFARRRNAGHPYTLSEETLFGPSGDYWLSMEEWFAEQTARWAQTSAQPLGKLGRFFKALARDVIAVMRELRRKFGGEDFRPEVEMQGYLDSLYNEGLKADWAQQALERMTLKGKRLVPNNLPSAVPDPGRHPNMANIRATIEFSLRKMADNNEIPPNVRTQLSAMAATLNTELDRFNWAYDLTINFRQLADLNPHIQELQFFREYLEKANLEMSNIMVNAEDRVKRWRQLPQPMRSALADFLFAMDDMVYLTPQEQARGTRRWYTQEEFVRLVRQFGLDQDTLKLYVDIRNDFLIAVKRIEELQMQEAMKITDPQARQQAMTNARALSAKLVSGPYFPRTRFGKYALTIRDANGKVEHFELFQSEREAKAAFQLANAQTGGRATFSIMPQEVQQFTGVPPWLLDKMMSMPGITAVQQQWLEQLRYELAPSQSYAKRLMKRKKISGFSFNARRAYAQYFFQHARFYARAKYDDALREQIDNMRKFATVPGVDVRKRSMMADFMEGVFKEFVNPSKDWSTFRSLTAIWHLGLNAASAMINMTQTVVASAPFLAVHFGDIKTMTKFMGVTKDLTTYYRRGTVAHSARTDEEMAAISKAIEEGIITESQAAHLAAISVGAGGRWTNSEVGERINAGWLKFSELSMIIFQMTEQWNRRVTFRAAYRLAFENPKVKWLQDLKTKHFLQYRDLIGQGWTERRALAYLAGKETIQQTHFTYDKLSRPKFMRGRKSSLFAFFMFTQSSLYLLWNNKQMLGRYMLIMAALAGPMGLLPDDVEDILNFIARKLMGKDFNLEREARKHLVELLGEDSKIPPDLILHGFGRYGFGIPAAAKMMGATIVPDIDLSRSVALQRVIPGAPTQFLNPGADWNTAVAKTTEGLAGAAFGIPLNLLKAVSATDLELTDLKRWEGAMPTALRNGVRSARLWYEGGERDRRYNQYIEYDRDSPGDIAELIAQGLGFQTLKNAQRWDVNSAEREVQAFYEIRRQMLVDRAYKARFFDKDLEEYKGVLQSIREFNMDAPGKELRITPETLKRSFKNRVERQQQTERGRNPMVDPAVSAKVRGLYPEAEAVLTRKVR